MSKELTAARLRAVLDYDPSTGVFTWINGQRLGLVAGSPDRRGYWTIKIDRRRYKAHRLAFLHMTGEWPHCDVDHERGDRQDNRWKKLREATPFQNQQNRLKAQKNNVSGLLGVSRRGSSFLASITANRKVYSLGTFKTAELAHAAYLAAKIRLHPDSTLSRESVSNRMED